MKKLISLLLVLVMVLSIVGCAKEKVADPAATTEPAATTDPAATTEPDATTEPAPDDAQKYAGRTLTIWSFTDELKPAVEYFQTKTGAKVELMITPTADYTTQIKPVLESGEGAPDVYTAEAAFVEEFVNNGYFENLSAAPYNAGDMAADYTPYVFKTGSDYDGNVRALSWQMTPGGIFYRRSIAKEVFGTDDPAEIGKLLGSTDKLFETARKLKEAGYRMFPDESAFRHFTNPKQVPWVDKDGNFQLPEEKIAYFDYSKQLRDEELTAIAPEWSPAWFGGMYGPITVGETADTTTVFAYSLPTWGLHYVLKTATDAEVKEGETPKNPTWGDWAVTSGPSPYFWGGTWLGIYTGSENKDMAWDFVQIMTHSDEFLAGWLKETGDVTSVLSIQKTYAADFTESFLNGQNHVQFFIDAANAIDGNRITKYDQDIDALFGAAVGDYVGGLATKEEAIQNFKDQVQMAFPEIKMN